MFTGLIEKVGKVERIDRKANVLKLKINLQDKEDDLREGESISINGVCLTLTNFSNNIVEFDVSPETVEKTNIPKLKGGDEVNIERALKVADRLGGHFVSGHVDGTASISKMTEKNDSCDIEFKCSSDLTETMVKKGSVAVDGVSLTIVDLKKGSFSAALIPHTLNKTTIGRKRVGDVVNLELDMVGKYVREEVRKYLTEDRGISEEKLKDYGFL